MRFKLSINLFIFLILTTGASADVIHLNSGQSFAGKMISENEIYVRFETVDADDGRIKEFLQSTVKSIELGVMRLPDVATPKSGKAAAEELPVAEMQVESSAPIQEFPKESIAISDEDIKRMLESGPAIEETTPEPPMVSDSSEETTSFGNDDIEAMLQEEKPKEPEVIEIEIPQEQIAQMEAQMQEMQQPGNMFKMTLMAIGMLLAMSAIPMGICGVIGFFLARKFDAEDLGSETVETIPPQGSASLGQPIIQTSAIIRPEADSTTPPPESEEEKTKTPPLPASPKKGGLIRRLIARNVDMYIGVGIIMVIFSVFGLFTPLDQMPVKMMLGILLPLMLVFFFYFFLGVAQFTNTYGRYLMNIKIVGNMSEARVTYGQAMKRDFLLFLWPIDFFVLVFSKAKRRIGDRFASTKVMVIPSKTKWLMRLIPGAVLGTLIFAFMYFGSPYVNDNMIITAAAKTYLGQKHGNDKLTRPHRVEILNYEGMVNMKLTTGECYSLNLVRVGERWTVQAATKVPENMLGWGYSIKHE